MDAEVPDAFVFVNACGELRAVDLNDGRVIFNGEKEHLVSVTLVADSKLCVVDKNGNMRLLQLTAPLMQVRLCFYWSLYFFRSIESCPVPSSTALYSF